MPSTPFIALSEVEGVSPAGEAVPPLDKVAAASVLGFLFFAALDSAAVAPLEGAIDDMKSEWKLSRRRRRRGLDLEGDWQFCVQWVRGQSLKVGDGLQGLCGGVLVAKSMVQYQEL